MRKRQPWQTGVQNACPRCGQQHVAEQTYSDTVEFRNLTLDTEGLQRYECADCYFQWHTDTQSAHNLEIQRTAYQVERDRVRQRDGLLGSNEIAQVREALGLNQREAAQLFGGGFNAFNKYESGEVLQSQAMDRLLRLALALGKAQAVPMLEAISRGEPAIGRPLASHEHGMFVEFVVSGFTKARSSPKAYRGKNKTQAKVDSVNDLSSAHSPPNIRSYHRQMRETLQT
jgi:putative zinc finger/helix-turn-helix YgiT family protein